MNIITATGESGRKYELKVYQINSIPPKSSGIYIFLKTINSIPHPIYIGETQNFYNRIYFDFENHQQRGCIKRSGSTHVAILEVFGSDQKRLDIETDLRRNYKTTCNLQ